MQLGMVGLGRMGANMARRLHGAGHHVVAYNRSETKTRDIMAEGIDGAFSPADAVAALDATNGAVVDTEPHLAFRSQEIFLRIDNFNFQAAWRLGIFERGLYNFNPDDAITEQNTPDVLSDVVYMQVGLTSMITAPGELAPEVFIGCYDGSCAGGWDFIQPNNSNPPDVSQAPGGPYLRDTLANDGSQFQWILGLAQDEVGYILPNYNYILADLSPYVTQADGDHYCETNSLGPLVHDQIVDALNALMQGN